MKNFKYNLVVVGVAVVTLGAAFTLGVFFGRGEATGFSGEVVAVDNQDLAKPDNVDFAAFWQAWNLLDEKYVNGTSTPDEKRQERVWGAISGMVGALDDPYTVFFPPEEKEQFEADISGNFSGVGMEVGVRNGILTVVAPLPDSPAKKAGIKSGDQIIKINEEPAALMTVDEAVRKIRGEKGTQVVLSISREGSEEAVEISITRDNINIPTIETEIKDGVFIISLYNFGGTATEKFKEALQEFVKSGSNKLVLDLRGNPGGYLDAAVEMASYFLPKDKVVVWEHKGDDEQDIAYRSRGYDIFSGELEMVVLVDQGSASASEILAGALKEHGVATLVGQTTFGKGSVQELVPVTKDTALKVTIARWLTPDGNSISNNGLEPDVPVELTLEDFKAGRDPQLERAIEILK